jgi:hypothetical protein
MVRLVFAGRLKLQLESKSNLALRNHGVFDHDRRARPIADVRSGVVTIRNHYRFEPFDLNAAMKN